MRSLTLKKRDDGVAVLLFDTPKRPVNVLSQEMLEEAGPLMKEIQEDDAIVACVLASGKTNVRAGPTLNSAIVAHFDPGAIVLVQRAGSDWWRAKPTKVSPWTSSAPK